MARKQKSKGFNKFLDLIGLVDTDTQGDDFDGEYDNGRGRARNTGRSAGVFDDEFADEPRMSRVSSQRRDRGAAQSSRFDADEGWGDTAGGRPEYGARAQQRTQRSSASGRYGSEQRYGASSASRASSRYDNLQADEHGASGAYRGSAYRTGAASYSYYGSSRSSDAENATFEMDTAADQRLQNGNSYQRHQTVIFKLHSVDECKGVILALIERKSVLLNLDELDSLQAQRTLDTMSGATFAIGARLSRASDRTWLITPSTVEVADSGAEPSGNPGGYGSGRFM